MDSNQIDILVNRGAETIAATGQPANEVARGILDEQWLSLASELQKVLGQLGLAKLINDEMSKRRATEIARRDAETEEFLKPYREREAKERQEQEERERQREERCEEANRQKAAQLAARRADPGYQEKVYRIHREIRCSLKACERGNFERIEWCIEQILNLPDDQQEAEIARRSEINGGFMDRIGDAMRFCYDSGYEKACDNLRSIMLISSDGSMKSLLDFSLADVKQWRRKARTNVLSWKQRRDWFRAAEMALGEAGVECIAELPPDGIRRLAEAAEAIWKKKGQGADAAV